MSQQTKEPGLSVTKFLRVLKQSVKRDTGLRSAVVQSPTVVFGLELSSHLTACRTSVPDVVRWCTNIIEQRGTSDVKSLEGIYRLSGQSSQIKALRLSFDAGQTPTRFDVANIHSVGSLLKLYFRELPEPVCTYSLYSYLVRAVRSEVGRRQKLMRQSVECLPPHNFSTLSHLLAHLHLLSQLSHKTGMTSRNLALVWAPNLVRPRHETRASEESLRDIGVQARVVEFLIENYQELFIRDNEVRRLRGNLSCQDVSLAVKDEEDLLSLPPQRRRQAVHFKESNRDSQYLPKAMCATLSVGSMSNVSVFPEPRAANSKPSSMLSYYKSLPALDQQDDQLDRELQHLSDSVDVLYQQEDSEIEFLDSFIDYDDISLDNSKSGLGRPPIIPSENLQSSRRDKIRESLRWLAYKGKFSWKQFGSRDNLRTTRGRRGAENDSKQKKVDLSIVSRSSSDLRHSRR